MNIELINKTKFQLPKKELENISALFLKKNLISCSSLALVFVGEARIKTLNLKYRQKNQATDILSFSAANFPGAGAELILCPKRIARYLDYREVFLDCPEYFSRRLTLVKKKKLQKYLLFFVVIHGLLHLIGLNDEKENDRQEMVALGRKFLADHGFFPA
jgi:probable rRNA maturation factor